MNHEWLEVLAEVECLRKQNRDWLDTFAAVCAKLGITEDGSDPKQLLSDNIASTVARHDYIREHLESLTSYALTCLTYNTYEWMDGLLKLCNEACEALGDPDRFERDGDHFREYSPAKEA